MKRITTSQLKKMKQTGEKIACLTAYDASFARIIDSVGMDVILVGDSLGMVIQGRMTTVHVTMNEMIYHTSIVARISQRAMVIADMPFHSYTTVAQGLGNAGRMIREGNANMVKLEGAGKNIDVIKSICDSGIPVCGHLGLTPQSVHQLGGYQVQGKNPEQARNILKDAIAIEDVGASMLVLECIPSALAQQIHQRLSIPVIGIGAGLECDGQVLVVQDMLGLSDMAPKFSKNFLIGKDSIADAITHYIKDIKKQKFPAKEHYMDVDS